MDCAHTHPPTHTHTQTHAHIPKSCLYKQQCAGRRKAGVAPGLSALTPRTVHSQCFFVFIFFSLWLLAFHFARMRSVHVWNPGSLCALVHCMGGGVDVQSLLGTLVIPFRAASDFSQSTRMHAHVHAFSHASIGARTPTIIDLAAL